MRRWRMGPLRVRSSALCWPIWIDCRNAEREMIGLKFVARLCNREIARVLQVPEGTVSSTLYRALGRLRTAFDEEERAR